MVAVIGTSKTNVMASVLESGMTVIYIDHGVTIEEPMFCITQGGEAPGQLGIQFVPVLMMTDEKACKPLNQSMVLVSYKPNESVSSAYEEFLIGLRAAKAGIVLPKGNAGLKTVK